MDIVNEIYNYIVNIPDSTWITAASYIGASTLVAGVLQIAKHKLNFAEAQKLVVFALGFLSFLVALVNFLLQNSTTLNALPYVSHLTGLLMAGAMVAHRFFVSPAYYKLSDKLQKINQALKNAEQKQSTGLPSNTVTATFSTNTGNTTFIPTPASPAEANLAQFEV